MTSAPDVRRKMLGAAAWLTASVFLSRVLGYARDAIVAGMHGAGVQTDVYYASFTLADLMSYMLAGGALSITFLPMFSAVLHEKGEEPAARLFGLVLTTMMVVMTVFVAIAWWFAPVFVPKLFPGFSGDSLAETIRLTRINLPGQLFFYAGGLCSATVMARTRFREAALAPLIYNLAIILGGVLGQRYGIEGFAWGAVVGAALGPFALNVWAAHHYGLRFYPRFAPLSSEFLRFVRVSLPVMVGFSLVSVDEWIGRYFASDLGHGAVSWLQNARRLMLVPVSVLGQAAGQATLPFLAQLRAQGRTDEAGRVLTDALRLVGFLTLVASAGFIGLAEPLVRVFYERGAFTVVDSVATAAALVPMSFGILAWALQAVAARGFYALGDTFTPMALATAVTVLSLPVYSTLGARFGVPGLGWATTIGMSATALVTLVALRARLPLRRMELARSLGRSLIVAATSGGAAWYAASAIDGPWLKLMVGGAAFGVVLLTGGLATKSPELRVTLNRVRRRPKPPR
jgi:putative peptidoglycan lipid II flippase